jgi:hypothetical protein
LTIEDGTNAFPRNVGNFKSTLRIIPEDGRFHTIAVQMANRGNESHILKLIFTAFLLVVLVPGIGEAANSFI